MIHKPIYVITTIEVDSKNEYSSSRCVGYFYDLEEAMTFVEENRMDIFETCYLYAVIEQTFQGVYPHIGLKRWYKFNLQNEKYEECEKPEFAMCSYSYGIG